MPLLIMSAMTGSTEIGSFGEMTMALTCFETRSSIILTWIAGSPVCGATHWKSTPSFVASSSAPIRQSSKNG